MIKNKIEHLILGISCFAITANGVAQSSTATTNYAPGRFLGFTNNGANPLLFLTNNTQRMQINGNQNTLTTVAAGSQNTSGFIGINVQNPLSRLHLGGPTLSLYGGYRPWMREGFTIQNADDQMWFGLKRWGASPDQQNAVINWGDDAAGAAGPDHLVFNFSGSSFSNPYQIPGINPSAATLDGLEVMRITDVGRVGIGPRFNNTFIPQSTLHQHQENSSPSWMQISNQASGGTANATAPTAITANDGLRWGIDNGNKAYIYNQENNPLLFSTNRFVNNAGVGSENERVRISHIGAVGSTNPHGIAQDRTRVSISHDPTAPIINPLSLLHIGYRLDNLGNPVGGTRNWMDVGMLVAQGTDHVWLGLKNEGDPNNVQDFNRRDAVLAWGDDFVSPTGFNTGPDKLRIIFTTPTTNFQFSGPGDMSSQNGLEFVRFVPFHNTVFNRNEPRMGVGNFEQLAIEPQNTLHVNSANNFNAPNGGGQVTGLGVPTGHSGIRLHDLRSIAIPRANPGLGVLSVDSVGDIIYVPAGGLSLANNGLTVNGGNVQLGGDCGNASLATLLSNREIPMNGFNLNFTNPANSSSQVLFGFPACNAVSAKLVANNDFHQAGIAGVSTVNSANPAVGVFGQTNNSGSGLSIGVYGLANASGASNAIGVNCEANGGTNSNVGVNGISNAIGAASNLAVNGTARNANILSIAGNLDVENSSSPTNIGHQSDVRFGTNPTSNNFGSQLKVNTMGANNYGVSAEAFGGTVNYAIFAATGASSNQTPPTGPNYAGYFNGDVVRTGTDNFTSDQNLKQNINPINNALSIINQLSPKTFVYKQADYPSMRLPSGIQYGLIAQEVQAILPELVNNNVHPPVFDSVGNIVTPAVNYLSLEYQQFMGILIKAIQEQQKTIDSLSTKQAKQDSINQSVQAQLAALASQINGCCTSAAAKVNQAPSQTQKTIHQMEIELSDKDAIVLEQNVPNPFAEQTTILYNLPTSVGKAQLMFYNVSGQLIKAVDLNTRGNGKLIVFANDLSSGLYHYTLVADGKVIDSKKMVRE
jgi:hypothetical protein